MTRNKVSFVSLIACLGILASCGNKQAPASSSTGSTPASSSTSKPSGKLASNVYDFSNASWQEKSKIVGALEKYAMENHSAGIPLYDDASYEQFSSRVKLPSTKYLTNYGFGVGYGSINGTNMYNGSIVESEEKWQSYFHGYTSTDSGTFNAWDATGSDVSSRYSMISSGYYGVKADATNTSYSWYGSLAIGNEPIMLDAKGNPVDLSGMSETDRNSEVSQFWRVPLHFGEGYTYSVPEGSKWYNKYNGRKIALEDYITPFKTMLVNRLTRYAELVSDSGGFQGAMEFVYDSKLQSGAWEDSGVGIQISPDGKGLDFKFIQAKSISYARTSLSSSLYSPIPEEFLKDIGGVKNFGKIGSGTDYYKVFDNFICFGPYVPEYWQQGSKIVWKKDATYFEANDYHYDGYTEVIYGGDDGDVRAYEAFLHNELDEVTIPVSYIETHKNDTNVYRTEGSTIIKLNINSTTQEEWEYYFGTNGVIYPHEETNYWPVKPIMSNEYFLNGMYFAINRGKYADMAGRNPAMGYLSNAYMLDPAGQVSYRASDVGKSVLANYELAAGEGNNGYSKSVAQSLFRRAAQEMIEGDYYEKGDVIEIKGIYRYQSTINNIGKYVAQDLEDAWNEACKDEFGLTLKVSLEVGGSAYTDTYTKMDHGEFDFAEGAISGNVLNPLEFMNTLSSTKSLNQGFNLNWGHRTDLVSEAHPCEYNGEIWSFDALYSSSQGFTAVEDGMTTPIAANERIEESGKNIVWKADWPANATDEQGRSLYSFIAKDFAIISGSAASYDGGLYYRDFSSNTNLSVSPNGYLAITIPKTAVTSVCGSVASDAKKTQNYFCLFFTLVYSVTLPSGTVTKAKQIQTAWVKLTDVGLKPVNPSAI